MAKYGFLTCPDCGAVVPKTSPNKKRCTECALRAHGQTGHGFADRACVVCGVIYTPTGSAQKACESCQSTYRRHKNIEHLARLRRAHGAIPKGSILICSECGDDFVYTSGPQHRCADCQKRVEVEKIHEWLKADPERTKQYSKKAVDNYNFGGNRQAALERDSYTCQHCGATDDLHVHHIDGQGVTTDKALRNNDLDNLITLCRCCHTKEHHKMRRQIASN